MPGFLCWHLKFCATRIHLDVIENCLRLIFLERSKICDEISIAFAKDAGYSTLREELFQLVLALCSPYNKAMNEQ